MLLRFLCRVLAPEKPQTVGLSQFCPHASPRVSGDLLMASEFYVQSHYSPCQPRLHCPLLPGVILARDPDSDSISPGHCAPPSRPRSSSAGSLLTPWTEQVQVEIGQTGHLWLLNVDYCPFAYLSVNSKELFLSGQVIRMTFGSFPAGWTVWKPASMNPKGSTRSCARKPLLWGKPRWELDFRCPLPSGRLLQNARVT